MNAERILGALVRDALGGGGRRTQRGRRRRGGGGSLLGGGMKGMLGMGALGVAIAAFDHYTRQQKTPGAQSFGGNYPPPPSPPAGGATQPGHGGVTPPLPPLPPLPPPPQGSSGRSGSASGSPPPPAPPSSPASTEDEALLMVRAMIAAANADHDLDAEERARIIRAVEESGVSDAEKKLLMEELERPMDIAALAARAPTPELKRELYLASELAIAVDSRAEENYLARLAKQLGLDAQAVAELRDLLPASDTRGTAS
jgi:hypothetical protein